MHNKQFYVVWRKSLAAVALLAVWASVPGLAATMAQPSKPDPLLDGGPTSACAAGADYAAGTDANGQAVVPADMAARPVPVPDAIAIPLGNNRANQTAHRAGANGQNGDSAYVSLDGKKLEPLINPRPCTDPGR